MQMMRKKDMKISCHGDKASTSMLSSVITFYKGANGIMNETVAGRGGQEIPL